MRVIFMGTPDFAVGTLEALIEAGHDVCLAVTQPDKPKGRGKEMQFPPVKEAALRHGIEVFQPVKVREPGCVEQLRQYEADVIVVVAFGQILPKEILELTRYGCINVHASLLPKYRGAAPIQWALISGESVTGVTTMQMDEGLDTGDMLLKTEVEITREDTGESLHDKLAKAGAELCVKTLDALREGSVTPKKQGETPTPYARMLDKKLGNINWNQSAEEIERLVRGLNSWPSAYTYWGDRVLKIWKADVVNSETASGTENTCIPGTVEIVAKDSFCVRTGDGYLQVKELQIPGKKRMETAAFLRGYELDPGTVFSAEPAKH